MNLTKEHFTEEMIDVIMDGNQDSKLWGPHVWATLESIIVNYDNNCKQDRKYLIQFIESLIHLMPCDECGDHFQTYIRENPLPFNRIDIIDWIIIAHDNVNERNGKDRYGFVEGLKDMSLRLLGRKGVLDNE